MRSGVRPQIHMWSEGPVPPGAVVGSCHGLVTQRGTMTDNFEEALPYLKKLSVLELLRVHRS